MTDSRGKKLVTDWIARVLHALGEGGSGGLKLSIDDPSGRKEILHEYPIGPETKSDMLAIQVVGDAQLQADGTGQGVHHFRLRALRNGETGPFTTTSFTLSAVDAPEDDRPQADGGTLLAQAQRHNETMMKIYAQAQTSAAHANASIIEKLTDMVNFFMSNQLATMQSAHQVTMDRAKLEYDVEMRKFIMQSVQMVVAQGAPILIPKLAAKLAAELDGDKALEHPPLAFGPTTFAAPQIPAQASPPIVHVDPAHPTEDPIAVDTPANGRAKKPKKR